MDTKENHSILDRRSRPHLCEKCLKRFTKLSDLKRHISTHTGEKPYTCGVCSKSFVKSSDLKRHELTHSGEKRFKCDRCFKCFTKASYLQRHMEKHVVDEPYKCGDCLQRFVCLADLRRHMESHLCEQLEHQSLSCGDAFETTVSPYNLLSDVKCEASDESMGQINSAADSCHGDRIHDEEPSDLGAAQESFGFAIPFSSDAKEATSNRELQLVAVKMEPDENVESLNAPFVHSCGVKTPDRLQRVYDDVFFGGFYSCEGCKRKFRCERFLKKHTLQGCLTKDDCMPRTTRCESNDENLIPLESVKTEPCIDVDSGNAQSLPSGVALTSDRHQCVDEARNTDGLYCCENCQKKFRYGRSFNKHRLLCCYGEDVGENQGEVHNDVTTVRKATAYVKRFQCKQCSRGFSKAHDLKRHERSHTGEKPYGCSQCPKWFSRSSDLTAHVLGHAGVKPYTCNSCSMSFSKPSALKMHTMIHSGDRRYRCDRCFAGFQRASALRLHMKGHSTDKSDSRLLDATLPTTMLKAESKFDVQGSKRQNRESCPTLMFTSFDTANRSDRSRFHRGELQPYVCDGCPKRFTRSHDLLRHTMQHSGEAPFICDQCWRCFTRLSYLTRHAMIHNCQSRSHLCDLCAKRFGSLSDLKRHMRSHSGEKPYVCDECSKRFTRHHDMVRHKQLHSGEKLFSCQTCSRNFARFSYLTKHMQTHSDYQIQRLDAISNGGRVGVTIKK